MTSRYRPLIKIFGKLATGCRTIAQAFCGAWRKVSQAEVGVGGAGASGDSVSQARDAGSPQRHSRHSPPGLPEGTPQRASLSPPGPHAPTPGTPRTLTVRPHGEARQTEQEQRHRPELGAGTASLRSHGPGVHARRAAGRAAAAGAAARPLPLLRH